MWKLSKKLYVQVPSKVVRNEDVSLDSCSFALYARLCFLYFRNYRNNEIQIDHRKLMCNLGIGDSRTLKSKLSVLHKQGLILKGIDKLPRKKQLTILLNKEPLDNMEHFTMLSAEVFDLLDNISYNSFRLLFYYKSHINLDDTHRDRSFCFVGYETLSNKLKMGRTTISESNEELKASKLIIIERHKIGHNYEYDESDELEFNKWNNHYKIVDSLL